MNQMPKSLLFPLLLVWYEIAIYLSNDMYLPAVPQMMVDLNLSMHQAQLTLTCWFAGAASLPLFMGAITDYYGRRPVLMVGGFVYIAATAVCAMAPNVSVLLAARLIEGSTMASMLVPGYASIHESYDQKHAIRILALMSSITVIAPALGPLMGAVVLLFGDWRDIFWVIVAVAVLPVVLLYFKMPETLPVHQRQPFHMGKLIGNYKKVVQNRAFLTNVMILGFVFCGFLTWVTTGPLLVMHYFHYTGIFFGCVQALVFSAYIAANRCVKYLMEWVGIHVLVNLGLVISLIGSLLAVGFAVLFPNALTGFIIAMILYSLGSGLNAACLNRLAVEACPEQPMGVRVALFTVFITSFAGLGSILASIFFNGSVLSLASLLLVCIIISCIIKVLQ